MKIALAALVIMIVSCNHEEIKYQDTKCTRIYIVKHYKEIYDSSVVILDTTNIFKSILYKNGNECCKFDSIIPDSNYYYFKKSISKWTSPFSEKLRVSGELNNNNCTTYGLLMDYADGRKSFTEIECSEVNNGTEIGWLEEIFNVFRKTIEPNLINCCNKINNQ